jgi:hypothetical protein
MLLFCRAGGSGNREITVCAVRCIDLRGVALVLNVANFRQQGLWEIRIGLEINRDLISRRIRNFQEKMQVPMPRIPVIFIDSAKQKPA